MRVFEWAIEDIVTAHPALFLEHCAAMAVALMKRNTASPCEFLVQVEGFDIIDLEGTAEFVLRVAWNSVTDETADRIERTEQGPTIVEGAAVAIAALLFAHLVPNSMMVGCPRGARADYWLPELHRALEVSGTEREQELDRRCHEKGKQVKANSRGWDGYVVVCCFAEDQRVIRWKHLAQREALDG